MAKRTKHTAEFRLRGGRAKVRSGRLSDEVARGRLVSLEGFSDAFRAKNREWRELQLVSQISFAGL